LNVRINETSSARCPAGANTDRKTRGSKEDDETTKIRKHRQREKCRVTKINGLRREKEGKKKKKKKKRKKKGKGVNHPGTYRKS